MTKQSDFNHDGNGYCGGELAGSRGMAFCHSFVQSGLNLGKEMGITNRRGHLISQPSPRYDKVLVTSMMKYCLACRTRPGIKCQGYQTAPDESALQTLFNVT